MFFFDLPIRDEPSGLNGHNPDKTKSVLDLSSFTGAMKGGSGENIAAAVRVMDMTADGIFTRPSIASRLVAIDSQCAGCQISLTSAAIKHALLMRREF